ncbi:MAG: cysteine dioxygenase family protein [Thermoanaerobaculia bacterium]
MTTLLYPEVATLVEQLDLAVGLGDVHRTTAAIKRSLSDLIRAGEIRLPERFFEPLPTSYARRLLHRDDERGYNAIVMTWGPGQGTALHDHGGIWCVEGVVAGEMAVLQYELTEIAGQPVDSHGELAAEQDPEAVYRFAPRGRVHALAGASGALIPPFEYHTLANALTDRVSVTLHVYGGEMSSCHLFEPIGADAQTGFRRVQKQLFLNN